MTSEILKDLTSPQREAVTHIDGPLLVLAGAGSGKTRVVTRRIAYLISQGVWPQQILAVTFTNKAAREMKERVEELVGEKAAWISTFHSACARFLRKDIEKMEDGRTRSFTIFDSNDQASLIKRILKETGLKDRLKMGPAAISGQISNRKNAILENASAVCAVEGDAVETVYRLYEEQLKQMNALDFDDLLLKVVRLLTEKPHLADVYRHRFRYLLIDEYQDTNQVQYELMRLLAGPSQNLHVTGDPDQSIYSWRGADYENIQRFERDFPQARVIRLEQNYRSTKTILQVANDVIRNNLNRKEKELFTENAVGCPVQAVCLNDDREEAEYVVQQILEWQRTGASLNQIALFYRTNAQSRQFEERMVQLGLPYQVVKGTQFYERKEIKDLLAHLRVLVNPRDTVAFERVVSCRSTGVGDKSLRVLINLAEKLETPIFDLVQQQDLRQIFTGRWSARLQHFGEWCRKLASLPQSPVLAGVEAVLEHSGLADHYLETDPDRAEDRLENLSAFMERAQEFTAQNPNASLNEFLEDVALVADVDAWDATVGAVSLMTLHSAKGLEFDHVFVTGVEEGLLPHANSVDMLEGEEEERRLFFVGMTRAKKHLIITCCRYRFQWQDKSSDRLPSRFLSEMPEDAVEFLGTFADYDELEADLEEDWFDNYIEQFPDYD